MADIDRQGIFEYTYTDPYTYYWQTGFPYIPEPGSTQVINIPVAKMKIVMYNVPDEDIKG